MSPSVALSNAALEVVIGYRWQRPADATHDRVDGISVRPAVADEDDGSLHFGFGHFAGERRAGTKVSREGIKPRSAHDEIDVAAAALRANQPCAPFRHGRLGTIPASLLGRLRFAAVAAGFTPDDEPQVRSGGAAEGHGCDMRAHN
jgi:hypothetical protein